MKNKNEANGAAAVVVDGTQQYLELKKIRRSPYNRTIDQKALDSDFIKSVKERGIIVPLLVRQKYRPDLDGHEWELVAGERRWAAGQLVGLDQAPVIVRALSDTEAMELQAIENQQRADLSPIEEAAKYQQLLEQYKIEGVTGEKAMARLCEKLGKKKATVYQALTLLALPDVVKAECSAGALPASHAGLIATLSQWPSAQVEALRTILKPEAHNEKDETGKMLSFRSSKKVIDDLKVLAKQRDKWDAAAAAASKEGLKILSDEISKKIFPYGNSYMRDADYVVASYRCLELQGNPQPYEKLLRKSPLKAQLAHDTNFNAYRVYPRQAALAEIKAAGFKLASGPSSACGSAEAARSKAAAARTRQETARRRVIVSAVVEKAGKPFPQTAPQAIEFARFLVQAMNQRALSDTVREMFNRRGLKREDYKTSGYNGSPHTTWIKQTLARVMTTEEARALLVDFAIAMDLSPWGGGKDQMLTSACHLFGVNPKAAAAKVAEKKAPAPKKPAKVQTPKPARVRAKMMKAARRRWAKARPKPLSTAGRKRLSAMMKARWAARRKAAAK